MSLLNKKYKSLKERKKVEEIKELYHKKPKDKCPNCNKKSLFYTNKTGEMFCIRCNERIK